MKLLLSILVLGFFVVAFHAMSIPEKIKEAEAVIKELPKTCQNAVKSQTKGLTNQRQACRRLESFEFLMDVVDCEDKHYTQLHDVICYNDGKYIG
jgi:hypothetical protein